MIIELIRDQSLPTCTLGRLLISGRTFYTMERPWVPDPDGKSGRKGVSCVAEGTYRLNRHDTEAYPKVWALVNPLLDVYHMPWEVPKGKELIARTAVLIHAANWAHELRGCIAPGKSKTRDGQGRWMVTRSRDAMNEIRTLIGSRLEVSLSISYNVPEGVAA